MGRLAPGGAFGAMRWVGTPPWGVRIGADAFGGGGSGRPQLATFPMELTHLQLTGIGKATAQLKKVRCEARRMTDRQTKESLSEGVSVDDTKEEGTSFLARSDVRRRSSAGADIGCAIATKGG